MASPNSVAGTPSSQQSTSTRAHSTPVTAAASTSTPSPSAVPTSAMHAMRLAAQSPTVSPSSSRTASPEPSFDIDHLHDPEAGAAAAASAAKKSCDIVPMSASISGPHTNSKRGCSVPGEDKGKGRLRSDLDAVVLGEQQGRKLCIRHQMMADEGTSAQLQESLDSLSFAQRSAVTSVWSTFSSSPAPLRLLILQGILQTCCFSQLSFLSESLADLIRIDPFVLIPREVSLKVLGYLDAISLARAAQVSRSWKNLADDDLLWRNMCEQHIERKCEKCGWGLPLLEKRRRGGKPGPVAPKVGNAKRALLASHTAHIAAAAGAAPAPSDGSVPMDIDGRPTKRQRSVGLSPSATPSAPSSPSSSRPASPTATPRSSRSLIPGISSSRPSSSRPSHSLTRPWKAVYTERLLIERNWRRGRCTIRTLSGHTEGVMCLQFDENSHPFPVLITGSYDRTARVWNLDTGEQVDVLRGHTRGVRALQFDEAKLITGSMDRTLKIWNWRTGECIRTLEGHSDGVVCLNYDKTVLASGSADATIKVWRFKTGDCFTLRGHRDWVNSVQLWDGQNSTGCTPSSSNPELDPILEASKMLFSASDDGTIRLWSLATRECVRVFEGHVGQVQCIKVIMVDRSTVANSCDDEERPPERVFAAPTPSPNEQLGASSSYPGFEAAGQALMQQDGPLFGTPAPPLTFGDPHANGLVPQTPTFARSYVHQPSLPVGSPPKRAPNSARTSDLLDSGPVPMLLSGALDNTIKQWDVATGRCTKTLFGHIEGVWAVDADRLRIVSTSHDRTIKIWDSDTGKCLSTLVGHAGAVTAVQLGGDRIVSAGDDHEVRIYSFAPE